MKVLSVLLIIQIVLCSCALGEGNNAYSAILEIKDEAGPLEKTQEVLEEYLPLISNSSSEDDFDEAFKARMTINAAIEDAINISSIEYPVSLRYLIDRFYYDNGWEFMYRDRLPIQPTEGDITDTEYYTRGEG